MAWGPDGRLYVTEDTGLLVVAPRGSRKPVVVARGLRTPLGLVGAGGRCSCRSRAGSADSSCAGRRLHNHRVVVSGLPFGEHQQDNVVLGRDGRL